MNEDDLEVFTLKAKHKEVSLVIDILNRVYNFKGDWNHISFFENNKKNIGSIMIPKGYFHMAEMQRRIA